MMAVVLVCILIVLLVIVTNLWAWYLLRHNRDVPEQLQERDWPPVAVLLPVRNEEKYLAACLKSLLQLEYPTEKLHILIGNDASTDRTAEIAAQWQVLHPQISVHNIEHNLGLARGKANVLAQLVHKCPAGVEYIFMTDADIRPNPLWIKGMLQGLGPGVGLVNGTTTVGGSGILARWQQTDWAVALGLAKAYTYLPGIGRTLTAIGNNMLISREAYRATGGYEAIPFSITEDFELMQQLNRQGYKAVQLMNRASSALTEPVAHVAALLHQRKRWMTGALRMPLLMVALLSVQYLFFGAFVVLLCLQPLTAILLLLMRLLAQNMLVGTVLKRTGIKQLPRAGLFYELYLFFFNLLLLLFYLLPIQINWKDRNYRNNRT
ncbi:glycosyltransferase [Cesiribacter sp. SM1]|uniref:glycosyltransferase n=1 Tax=Cesiribacter sp. SM1 TaxID=2861196 RepID=UPI001CD48601|nr:glycosyltransferase [Cesiribacter sp. SM1]